MRGCDMCAIQTLRRYKGSDKDLLEKFNEALTAVRDYQQKMAEEQNPTQVILEFA